MLPCLKKYNLKIGQNQNFERDCLDLSHCTYFFFVNKLNFDSSVDKKGKIFVIECVWATDWFLFVVNRILKTIYFPLIENGFSVRLNWWIFWYISGILSFIRLYSWPRVASYLNLPNWKKTSKSHLFQIWTFTLFSLLGIENLELLWVDINFFLGI